MNEKLMEERSGSSIFDASGDAKSADIKELIDAATPFLSGHVVDETSGTIPLMDRLEKAIERAKKIL